MNPTDLPPASTVTVPASASLPPKSKDAVFQEKLGQVHDFGFNDQVASVFDDMVERSVPFCGEIQRMILEMPEDFAVDGSNIYDLGCATGTTMEGLLRSLTKDVKLIGIDHSREMLAKCEEKLVSDQARLPVELVEGDLNGQLSLNNASVVIMVLTLQFVRPLPREIPVRSIYNGMNHQGALTLVKKTLGEDSTINRLFIEYYHRLKRRQGYTKLEIFQKREALENVLVPYKLMGNRQLARYVGFRA